MNIIREHHVAGQAPNWSRPSQAFRHFDGTLADWRTAHPGHRELARRHRAGPRARLRRAGRALQTCSAMASERLKACARSAREWLQFEDILLGPAGQRRDIAVFTVGVAWGVMCAIGMMAAWGIHP